MWIMVVLNLNKMPAHLNDLLKNEIAIFSRHNEHHRIYILFQYKYMLATEKESVIS